MEIINTGKIIPIEMTEYVADLEMRYEEGMRAYIVKVFEDKNGSIVFQTEERDFAIIINH